MTSNSSEFADLNVSEWLVEQCTAMGILTPTPVQRHCIPKILNGENCIGVSETGSGKTIAFAIPILQKLSIDPYGIYALILTPTRELASQIADQFKVIGKPMHLEASLIIGGMNMVTQGGELNSQPHVVVATPGRLADLLQTGNACFFKRIKFLVLDEADRLLGGQYTDQLEVILDVLPPKDKRQTLLFSATMTDMLEVAQQAAGVEPFIWTAESDVSTVEHLDQSYVLLPRMISKNASLVEIVNNFQGKFPDNSIIIFTQNCKWCQIVSVALRNLGFENVALNSNLKQKERISSISKFKSNQIKLLIATDLASRGLDIPMVDLVINYNVPIFPKTYIHRVGRTARAGRKGQAITLVTPRDIPKLKSIEDEINTQITELKVSEKKVLTILLQVEVAFKEARISLEGEEADVRKEHNKRKHEILEGSLLTKKSQKRKSKDSDDIELEGKKLKKNVRRRLQYEA